MANPRRAETEAALAGFYDRVRRGKAPKRRRYNRVVGGVAGRHHHQRKKREQQRKNAGSWRNPQPPLWTP